MDVALLQVSEIHLVSGASVWTCSRLSMSYLSLGWTRSTGSLMGLVCRAMAATYLLTVAYCR